MAMRQSRFGGASTAARPQVFGRAVYEDFQPVSEWIEKEDANVLLVYFPGFMKEQISVRSESNILRIRGERLVGVNKWSRFREEFRIPENCNTNAISAKFESSMLRVTMPKGIITRPISQDQSQVPQQKASTLPKPMPDIKPQSTQENIPKKDESKLNTRKVEVEALSNFTSNAINEKRTDTKKESNNEREIDRKSKAKNQKGQDEPSSKVTSSTSDEKQIDKKSEPKTQKDLDDAKATSSTVNEKQVDTRRVPKIQMGQDETPAKVILSTIDEKQVDKKSEPTTRKDLDDQKPTSSTASEKQMETKRELRSQMGQDETPSKATLNDEKQAVKKSKESLSPQKGTSEGDSKLQTGQDGTLPKTPSDKRSDVAPIGSTTSASVVQNLVGEKDAKEVEKKPKEHRDREEKNERPKEEVIEKTKELRETEKATEIDNEKEREAKKPKKESQKAIGRVTEKVTDTTSSGGYRLDEHKKKTAKGFAKGLDEERQLLVNVGVAVLVIVALGAYIYYTSKSSGKSKGQNF